MPPNTQGWPRCATPSQWNGLIFPRVTMSLIDNRLSSPTCTISCGNSGMISPFSRADPARGQRRRRGGVGDEPQLVTSDGH